MHHITKTLLFVLIAWLSLAASCKKTKSPKPVAETPNTTTIKGIKEPGSAYFLNDFGERSDVILHLTLTPCLGKCPNYEVLVFENGNAEYIGRKNAPREGTYTSELSDTLLFQMRKKLADMNFYQLADQYPERGKFITDLPNTILYYAESGKGKRIKCNYGFPPALSDYNNWLRQTFEALPWKKIKE